MLPAGTRVLFLGVQLEEEVQQEKEALDLMVNLKEAWANLFLFGHKIEGVNYMGVCVAVVAVLG